MAGREDVEFCRLHLDPQNAMPHHLLVQVGPLVIEHIR